MEIFYILIKDGLYVYEESVIKKDGIHPAKIKQQRKQPKLLLEGLFVFYLIKELKNSQTFRNSFLEHQRICLNGRNCLEIILQPTKTDLIDYNWNRRLSEMVRERSELDHVFSWLSTLGGAYSALGDYFVECAETAAKISVNQFKLALRLGDPQMAARCKLYLSLSLIQRKNFKWARQIIYNQYKQALSAVVVDIRLLRMCKGIWAKLQYEHFLHVQQKQTTKMKEI